MNIASTRLRNQLNPLRQRAQTLSVQFDELQEEVRNKREEKARRGPRDMAQAQTELIRLRRELEVCLMSVTHGRQYMHVHANDTCTHTQIVHTGKRIIISCTHIWT